MATRKRPETSEGVRNALVPAVAPDRPGGEILLYQTEDGRSRVECRFADESLWMSQAMMAELFQTTPQNITLHLKALLPRGGNRGKGNL